MSDSHEDFELPPELLELEQELAGRQMPGLPPDHRGSVLAAVRQELAKRDSVRLILRRRWEFAAAVAALVLCWLNLSMSAANNTDFNLRQTSPISTAAN
jgi:hypothetical protein